MEIINQRVWVRNRLAIVGEEHKKRFSVENHPFVMLGSLERTENKSG